jgi:hypothetical protein
MDAPEIEERFLIAGSEYGRALADLGLDPHALFWAYDGREARHVLVLLTDFFDYTGPLEISRQLFRAYNASATPSAIDPFIVRLHSVNQPAGAELLKWAAGDWKGKVFDQHTLRQKGDEFEIGNINSFGLDIRPNWVIRARKMSKKHASVELGRRWRRFTTNLDRIAA